MHLWSLDGSRACTGTTRSTLSPDTALIVQFSVWAAQIGGKTSPRAERRSCLRTLLWTSRGSSSASWVCLQYSAGSLWRTATPLRVGESPAHQSLPSPFTVRCGSPSKLIERKGKKNTWGKKRPTCCIVKAGEREGQREDERKKVVRRGSRGMIRARAQGITASNLRRIVMMKSKMPSELKRARFLLLGR